MLKHYVEFMYPGLIFTETSAREIPDREHIGPIDERAFAYRFFDRTEEERDGETLRGKRQIDSVNHFLGGDVFTAEEAERQFPDKAILLANIRANGIKRVIRTRFGQVTEFGDNDVVVRASEAAKIAKVPR